MNSINKNIKFNIKNTNKDIKNLINYFTKFKNFTIIPT